MKRQFKQILALIANHMRFKDIPEMKPATLKRFVRLAHFDEHLELHRLDCSSSHQNLENYNRIRRFLSETPPQQVRPPRLVTGEDLIALGFTPGPTFRRILEAVEDGQLDGTLKSKQDALFFIRESFKSQ